MKKIITIVFLIVFSSGALFAQRTYEKEFSVDKGDLLDLNIEAGGDIVIEGWNKDKVSIKARFRWDYEDDYRIESRSGSGRVSFDVELYERRRRDHYNSNNNVDIEIKVPKEFDIRLEALAGNVDLIDFKGEIKGKVVAGNVDIRKLEGYIDLETVAGNIKVRDSKLDGSLETVAGNINVRDNDGRIREKNTVEDIASNINVNLGNLGKEISRSVSRDIDRERRNSYSYSYRSSRDSDEITRIVRSGSINVRDAEYGADLKTGDGNITVRYAGEFVAAETGDGNIRIDELDGSIEALTDRGDIVINVIEDRYTKRRKIELESLGGDIELTVPRDFPMDIDIEIEYSENSRKNYKIESDYSLSKKESPDWERPSRKRNSDGDPVWDRDDKVKKITAKGKEGNGRNRIVIRTVNGNVKLKRGR